MDCSLLKLATDRRIGWREWAGLRLGVDTGSVRFGIPQTYPTRLDDDLWFMWHFHEHRGGSGGLALRTYKERIRVMVTNLTKHNQEAT